MKQSSNAGDDVISTMTHAGNGETDTTLEEELDSRLFLDRLHTGMDIEGECIDASDLPTSLIITGVDSRIFSAGELRSEFESLFKRYEDTTTFQYFKSFRRVRVNFEDPSNAAAARIRCHEMKFGDNIVNVYFAQPLNMTQEELKDSSHLQPPPLTKQFLISPPVSPPPGWEPINEGRPIINYELLAAISQLTPGAAHELHPPTGNQPGIVVHICEEEGEDETFSLKTKIPQTPRPPGRSESVGSVDSECATPP